MDHRPGGSSSFPDSSHSDMQHIINSESQNLQSATETSLGSNKAPIVFAERRMLLTPQKPNVLTPYGPIATAVAPRPIQTEDQYLRSELQCLKEELGSQAREAESYVDKNRKEAISATEIALSPYRSEYAACARQYEEEARHEGTMQVQREKTMADAKLNQTYFETETTMQQRNSMLQSAEREALRTETNLSSVMQAELHQYQKTQELEHQKVQLSLQASHAATEAETLRHKATSAVQQMRQAEVTAADASVAATGLQQKLA